MDRRRLVGGGLLGMTALLGGGAKAFAQGDRDRGLDTARAVDEVRTLLERVFEAPFAELAEIRQQQRIFLKASHKYPDFIEVGVSVWERVCDWHVRHQLPLTVVRRDDGRYTMALMFTTLVLRPDQADGYVSFGYDAR
jgi:hypothetical protein